MKAANLALYHFDSCPYCERVRGALRRLGVEVELRNVQNEPKFLDELVSATGRQMVPCLRIEQPGGAARWMHESADIIRYLEAEVAPRG